MSEPTYVLEWRGTSKPGYSYADIEDGLASGELHSLHKINVDGRWLVLRDFVEQKRVSLMTRPAEEQVHSPYAPQPAFPPTPTAAPVQHASAPALTLQSSSAEKPVWFWPTVILSSTVCLLLAAVLTFLFATSRSSSQRTVTESKPEARPAESKPEARPAESKPAEMLAAVTPENKPAEVKPAEIHAAVTPENKPAEIKPAEMLADNKPANKPAETKPAETKPAEMPAEAKAENKSAISKSAEKIAENKAEKSAKKPQPVKFQPYSITGKEIFPSAVVSAATFDWNGDAQSAEDKKTDEDAQLRKHELPLYGDENSWLGIIFEGVKKGAKVSVEITSDGLMKPSKEQVTMNAVGEKGYVQVMPKILWDYGMLMKASQQRPIHVIFSASIDGTALPQVTETYTLRSINDCPLYLKDKAGKPVVDLKFLIAAYVNENHPRVQEILKEARACKIVGQFDGYQSNDPIVVKSQIYAVWNALQRRGITYSSVDSTPQGERVLCQSMRFLHESIDNQQANCVDGTILMASVLEKIGIQCYLVLIPHHCFLAFNLTENSAALPTGLETTMLGANTITDVNKMNLLPAQVKNKENQASLKTFIAAIQSGDQQIQSCARELLSGGSADYMLISIGESRKRGVMPFPFTANK